MTFLVKTLQLKLIALAVSLAFTTPLHAIPDGDLFEIPVRLKAAGEFIDVDTGHAAPLIYDFDGDGVRDLLVGQFGKGKLRIYRNAGTNESPEYEAHTWFKTGDTFGTVPYG